VENSGRPSGSSLQDRARSLSCIFYAAPLRWNGGAAKRLQGNQLLPPSFAEIPGALAIRPTKFEMVIDRKTAKPPGIAIAPILLARADEVSA
jgi:hypothetical protein